jgi:hypothetical protein
MLLDRGWESNTHFLSDALPSELEGQVGKDMLLHIHNVINI